MSELTKLSREGHLFLSLAEMKAIQAYFRQQEREPTDIELETLAQTWSEHCVHKTLKSAVEVEVRDEKGKTIETRQYENLIKETIFASTPAADGAMGEDFCLSVFKDNAGVIAFDETDAVCFKVETHNHPSAIEPYGGSATGVGGVIRDVLGTGLAAKPVANTDVFCVALPDYLEAKACPKGVIHPKRVLQQVVAGRARLRQPHGDSHRQRRGLFRRPVSGQSAGFLRLRGPDPARTRSIKPTGAGDAIVRHGRADGPGWNSRGDIFQRGIDRHACR